MNLNSLALKLSQLKSLCSSLTNQKSQRVCEEEINSLCSSIGVDSTTYLTRVLLHFQQTGEDTPVHSAVLSELSSLLSSGAGRAAFCSAADQKKSTQLLPLVTESLGLSSGNSLALGLSLTHSQCHTVKEAADQFVQEKFGQVLEEICQSSLKDLPPILHGLLVYIRTHPNLVTEQLKQKFYANIQKSFQPNVPALLRPLLPQKQALDLFEPAGITMESHSLPDLLREVGYAATATISDCQKVLSKCSTIDAPTVARSLFIMGITCQGLESTDPTMASTFLEREFTASDIPSTWKADVLAEALLARDPSLNWYEIVQSLDFPGFVVKDVNALKIIVNAVRKGLQPKDKTSTFPVDRLLQRWNNREGQFSILKIALHNPEVIPFGEAECLQVHINVLKVPPDETDRQVANWRSINLMEALLNLGEDASVREGVKDLIKIGMASCPDVIILSLAQAQTQWTSLRKELLDSLIYRYFNPNNNSTSVLVYIWNNCGQMPQVRQLLMSALKQYYKENPTDQNRLGRIIEIAHEIKALKNIIKINNEDDFTFGIELAILASRRNYVNLKMWFDDNKHDRVFIDELLKYYSQTKRLSLSIDVQKIIEDALRPVVSSTQQTLPGMISPNIGPVHDDILRQNFQGLSLSPNPVSLSSQIGDVSSYKATQFTDFPSQPVTNNSIFHSISTSQQNTISPTTVPGLPSFGEQSLPQSLPFLGQNSPTPAGFNGMSQSLCLPITKAQQFNPSFNIFGDQRQDSYRDHIDALFKELFEKTITPDKFVEQVKRMKQNPTQQKEFKFVLENLHQEFKHLYKFPADPLQITAHVWGKILAEELLEDTAYCEKFLKKVLEALEQGMRNTQGYEKMFVFGETVLQQFILLNKDPRILKKKKIYQTFCERMITAQWFKMGGDKRLQPPKLVFMIKECGESNMNTPSMAPKPNSDSIQSRPDIAEPPEEIQDRIGFIYNNLSINNLKQKSVEMRQALDTNPDYLLWLANYIVVKRVLKEENFLQTYADVVEELSTKIEGTKVIFSEMVKDELISAIKQLLQKDKQSGDMESRKILKHFGAFLGLITIARDKPILADDIDFRFLLLEAHIKGHVELQFVVPFVVKVLEATKKSRLFQLKVPPEDTGDDPRAKKASGNAWTLGVMNTLMELYKSSDATLNLKFEVEILCKEHLKLELEQFETAEPFLTNEDARRSIISQLSAPKQASPVDQTSPQSQTTHHENRSAAPPPAAPPTVFQSSMMQQPPQVLPQPNQPKFHYEQIDHEADLYPALEKFIKVRDLPGIGSIEAVKRHMIVAIQNALLEKDLMQRIIDRSSKIATTATENLVKKDFALDSDENLMLTSAHNLARYLGAGMAMNSLVTNSEFLNSITNHLLDEFMNQYPNKDPKTKDMLARTAKILATDNSDLVVNYVQKRAAERAVTIITSRLRDELHIRRHTRGEGNDRAFLATRQDLIHYHIHRMPEPLRLSPGSIKPEQLAVYDDYARNIPGFIPSNDFKPLRRTAPKLQAHWLSETGVQLYQEFVQQFYDDAKDGPFGSIDSANFLNPVFEAIRTAGLQRDEDSTTEFIQRLVIRFFIAYNRSQQEAEGSDLKYSWEYMTRILARRLVLLQPIFDKLVQPNWFAGRVLFSLQCKNSTTLLLDPQLIDPRFAEAIKLLIFNNLINAQEYDKALVISMRGISSIRDTSQINPLQYIDRCILFATHLLASMFEDRSPSQKPEPQEWTQEFSHTINIMAQFSASNQIHEDTKHKIDQFKIKYNDIISIFNKNSSDPAKAMMMDGIKEAINRVVDSQDLPKEIIAGLLREWVGTYCTRDAGRDSTRGFSAFVTSMHKHGILETDYKIVRFFRVCTEICADVSPQEEVKGRYHVYNQIDAFVRLVCLLIKHSGDAHNPATKVNLLNKVLGIVIGICVEHQKNSTDFYPMPFQRIFIMLFYELCAPEAVLESINWHTLMAFSNAYHYLCPIKAPGFVFSWLELIGYRTFVMRMMQHSPDKKGWPIYAQLLSDLFKFMAPYLREPSRMTKAFQKLYDGMIRLLLVLFHDYPLFLLSYHYAFCDIIPANCIQLRNLVLSAFPTPVPGQYDPKKLFSEDNIHEKLKGYREMYSSPSILTKYKRAILPEEFMLKLKDYLENRCMESSATFLTSELVSYLQATNDQRAIGLKWNTPLINAVVLYVGSQAIQQINNQPTSPSPDTVAHNAYMDIFQALAVGLDSEGRYQFLNAIANQLRYPNIHTWYFMEVIIYLFAESNKHVKEQISRVLLERVFPLGPHPWGMIVTVMRLFKREDLWNSDFVNCHENIRKKIEDFYTSCTDKRSIQNPPKLTNEVPQKIPQLA